MHFEHSTAGAGSERVDAYAYAFGQRAVEVIICMITRDFSVISMTSQASLSLSLYYSQKSLTHNIGSASALPIIGSASALPIIIIGSIIIGSIIIGSIIIGLMEQY